MDDRLRQPEDPDAIDRDPTRAPNPDGPHPGREPGADEGSMRLPGEEGAEVIGSGDPIPSGDEADEPDAAGATEG